MKFWRGLTLALLSGAAIAAVSLAPAAAQVTTSPVPPVARPKPPTAAKPAPPKPPEVNKPADGKTAPRKPGEPEERKQEPYAAIAGGSLAAIT